MRDELDIAFEQLEHDTAAKLPQRSKEWSTKRAGLITASKAHLLMKPKGLGQDLKLWDYLLLKAFERKTGRCAEFGGYETKEVRHGIAMEQKALEAFQKRTGIKLLGTPGVFSKGDVAASPDDMAEAKYWSAEDWWPRATVETKCFSLAHHLRVCEATDGPSLAAIDFAIYCQIQCQLYVKGLSHGYFVAFYTPLLDYHGNPEIPKGETEPLPDHLHWCRVEADSDWQVVFEARVVEAVGHINRMAGKEGQGE